MGALSNSQEKTLQAGRNQPDFEQASGAGRCDCWRIDWIHPGELLGKVPHIEFALQLWFERTGHLLLRQVVPVQALEGTRSRRNSC